jgi:two-component system, OmpR family, heavy metal sensor histidine kinase CusS
MASSHNFFGKNMILQHSLTLRLTCFFSVAAITGLVSLSLFLKNEMSNYFMAEDIHQLKNKAYVIREIISKHNFNEEFAELVKKMEDLEGVAIRVGNPNDKIILYVSDNIRFPDNVINEENNQFIGYDIQQNTPKFNPNKIEKGLRFGEQQEQLLEWEDKHNTYRGMQFHFNFDDQNNSTVFATIAINTSHRQGFLHAFKAALVKFTVITALISGALQWFLTYHGLRPLKVLSKRAKLISGNDIKQRMPVENLPIEILGLSETLNNMLDRLDESFQRLEDFSSDIAHELRTPINNLMMQTQVVLSKPRDKHEYLMALGSNVEEFERLARMISDMLFLAKADNDQLLLSKETIDLGQGMRELFEFYDALAEDRNITLALEGSAQVQGDRLMLRRAFNNLISNAIHHSFEGSEIKIKIHAHQQSVSVEVINHGETIAPEHIAHIFDRFYRADKVRTSCSYERVGLGLAITLSIAKAHGGFISVTSIDQVTNFTFVINKADT